MATKHLNDPYWMRLALRLAHRGAGLSGANPAVGAVLVKEGRCVGSGYHTWAESRHAEIWALDRAGEEARGATCYITLEPCHHEGRTPPCTRALAEAGVSRVVYGVADPQPHAGGAGPAWLTDEGIAVEEGCLEREAARHHEGFLHAVRTGRSLLVAKAACGPDGRLATHQRESRWISGESSRRLYRRLRGRYDAVMVGAGTARDDDPHLGVRTQSSGEGASEGPAAVVLDGELRGLGADSRLAARARAGERVLVYCRPGVGEERQSQLEEAGIRIVQVPSGRAGRGVALQAVAEDLARQGLLRVLVEGGGRLLGELFDLGLADRVLLFQAPLLLGGAAAPQLWAGQGVGSMELAPRFREVDRFPLGDDLVTEATVVWPADSGPGRGASGSLR